jgi:hypothetical protein
MQPDAAFMRELQRHVDAAEACLRNSPYSAALLGPWRVCVLDADRTIEDNFPHTHADAVCLPSSFFGAREGRTEVLIHERVHVHQRLFPPALPGRPVLRSALPWSDSRAVPVRLTAEGGYVEAFGEGHDDDYEHPCEEMSYVVARSVCLACSTSPPGVSQVH